MARRPCSRRSTCSTGRSSARTASAIERQVPADKEIHVILDNYAAHKHAKVRAWLARHPRWTFHFTPTSCSWLNAVEGFFAKLTRQRLKHGVFHSLVDLQRAINTFVDIHNQKPKPFIWKMPNAGARHAAGTASATGAATNLWVRPMCRPKSAPRPAP